MMQKILEKPGDFFFQTNLRRQIYKTATRIFCHKRLVAHNKLIRSLPPSEYEIGPQGYLVLRPQDELHSRAVAAAGKITAERSKFQGYSLEDYKFLRNLLYLQDLDRYPEILQYGLSEQIIATVSRYLGQLPIMPFVLIWRSTPTNAPLVESQLWHLDHSDTKQVKIFVFLDEVTDDNGPLVLIPAHLSQKLRKKLRYNWREKRRVSDAHISELINPDDVVKMTGPKGTVVLVDTSRCFHHGSRLQKGIRHVLLYRYLTISSFLFNPFRAQTYPLQRFSANPDLSLMQRTVLTGAL